MCGTYIYTIEYYLAIKKTPNLSISAIWTDLKGIMLSEKKAEEKILYIIYMWNLKNKTN